MRQGLVLLLSASALACPPLLAADSAAGNPAAALAAADAQMLAQRRQLIAKSLHLPPEIGDKFWPIYDRYQVELGKIRTARHEILGELGENYDNMSDADAREYVMDKLNLEEDRARIAKRYVLEMAKVLPPRELARYIQIESKIEAFIEAGIEEEIPLIK